MAAAVNVPQHSLGTADDEWNKPEVELSWISIPQLMSSAGTSAFSKGNHFTTGLRGGGRVEKILYMQRSGAVRILVCSGDTRSPETCMRYWIIVWPDGACAEVGAT